MVQAALADVTTGEETACERLMSVEPETALRVLMVRLLPRARASGLSAEERQLALGYLLWMTDVASGSDWRYLDAWHCAFEALEDWRWSRGERSTFLTTYRSILSRQLRRLGSALC